MGQDGFIHTLQVKHHISFVVDQLVVSSITAQNGQLTGAAYSAYMGLCTAAAAALNAQLEETGMDPVTLTPSNYSAVLLGLLAKLDADAVYNAAYQAALQQVTAQVESQAVSAQLMENGYTDAQKAQILQGAVASLTDEQKAQIREAYIQQIMASDAVTAQINDAVAGVSAAAEQVSELKGQLDNYGAFYQGLLNYTGAVSDAAPGAKTLQLNLETLSKNTGTLQISVGELDDAVRQLYGGTKDLAGGTSEFADETADMDTQISDEIDAMTASITGGDEAVASFVSAKNTNVDAVQFVIKTAAIEQAETAETDAAPEAPLTFAQKLLRLFGLY